MSNQTDLKHVGTPATGNTAPAGTNSSSKNAAPKTSVILTPTGKEYLK